MLANLGSNRLWPSKLLPSFLLLLLLLLLYPSELLPLSRKYCWHLLEKCIVGTCQSEEILRSRTFPGVIQDEVLLGLQRRGFFDAYIFSHYQLILSYFRFLDRKLQLNPDITDPPVTEIRLMQLFLVLGLVIPVESCNNVPASNGNLPITEVILQSLKRIFIIFYIGNDRNPPITDKNSWSEN